MIYETSRNWGIWNSMEKRFVFGISKPTKQTAEKELFNLIGWGSAKWHFAPKVIPENWKNPPNLAYKKA